MINIILSLFFVGSLDTKLAFNYFCFIAFGERLFYCPYYFGKCKSEHAHMEGGSVWSCFNSCYFQNWRWSDQASKWLLVCNLHYMKILMCGPMCISICWKIGTEKYCVIWAIIWLIIWGRWCFRIYILDLM